MTPPRRPAAPPPAALLLLVVLGAACPAPGRRPAPPQEARDSVAVDGLLFTGTTRVWGAGADSIAVAVRLTNRRAVPLAYGYGACVLDPRLVRPGGTPDRPAYAWSARPESSLVRRSDGSLGAVYWGCPMYLAMGRLAPGASDAPSEFAWREGLDSVRADSLRGPYRVVARLRLLGRAFDVPAGAIRLP